MKISTVNYLLDGASIAVNSMFLRNANAQLEPFVGSPCQFIDPGEIGFNLGSVRTVGCVALCGMQCYSYTLSVTGFQVNWELRNGGSGGTVVASGLFNGTCYIDFNENQVEFIDEVEADYFRITFAGATQPYYSASRIWVGNTISLPKENGFVYRCLNEAIVETSRSGEDFVLQRRYRSEVSFQSFEIQDNLETADASENGDFESVYNALALVGSMQEVIVSCSFADFHGKLTIPATYVKAASDQYQVQFSVREF